MRLLLIEDNPLMLNSLARELKEEGYVVDIAHDGEEGLYRAENWSYDGIILDLMLPGLHGYEIIQRLRRRYSTPILVITSRDGIEDRVKGLDLGADDYLIKPFDLNELFARLRSILRRSSGREINVSRIGNVMIDHQARKVAVAGEEIVLTRREFILLQALVNRIGRVVSTIFLSDYLAEGDEPVSANALGVHVHSLRRKLGKDFIRTARGEGYIIDAS